MNTLSPDVVRTAYQLFLNREPESSAVVEEKIASCRTYAELTHAFVSCEEFQSRYPLIRLEIDRAYWASPPKVDVDVSRGTLERLLARVRKQWSKLGQSDPYWSVLTHNDFRKHNLDEEKLAAFYESGRKVGQIIELFEKRTEVQIPRGVCFELGCGVGRVTTFLAQRFSEVVAADISPGNLSLCEQRMRDLGVQNVRTVLLESPEQLATIGPCDFFYSVIVLQHNPPPVQKMFLSSILPKITRGGGCLFQTPSALPDYSFSAETYLGSDEQTMDMHCLPKPVVLRLLSDQGMKILDVQADPWVGTFGSYTYFAIK